MSRKRVIVGLAMTALLVLSVPAWGQDTQTQQPKPEQAQAQPQPGTLKLMVKYNGSDGPVDQTHKILIFVFDSPDIGSGATMPIRFETIAENGGAVSIPSTVTPVYVAVVYDKPGGYELTGPPASGCPAAIYARDSQGPAPIEIEPEKTTEVSLEFDDSTRVP